MSTIKYDGRAIELDGLAGKLLTLQPSTSAALLQAAGPATYSWAPPDRAARDVELRVRIEDLAATVGASFVVYYWLEISAGESAFREVSTLPKVVGGVPVQNFALPERGMVLRLSARALKIGFTLQQLAGTVRSAKVQVSVQPSSGAQAPAVSPRATTVFNTPFRTAIPMSAWQWRFRDPLSGAAFAAGTMGYINMAGLAGPVLNLAALGDWQPIPSFARVVSASVAFTVEFQ